MKRFKYVGPTLGLLLMPFVSYAHPAHGEPHTHPMTAVLLSLATVAVIHRIAKYTRRAHSAIRKR